MNNRMYKKKGEKKPPKLGIHEEKKINVDRKKERHQNI